jgi:hypothetical protein
MPCFLLPCIKSPCWCGGIVYFMQQSG